MSGRLRWAVLLPLLLFLAHALLFDGWIIDDAGISFSYARNLAAGHGLVSQPGLPPVEGFSNFLWVMVCALLFVVRLFHPVITPKLLSLALTAGSFVLLHRSLRSLTGGRLAALLPLVLLALCTPFVIWSVSGLENPLYVFLLCLLLRLVVRERERGPSNGGAWTAGAVAAALAMTRPDGIVFAALYPLLTILVEPLRGPWRPRIGRLVRSTATFAVLFGLFLAFRWHTFGDLYPNTYYAKGGPSHGVVLDLLTLQPRMMTKVFRLMESVGGEGGVLVLALLLAATAFLIGRRRFRAELGVLLAFALFGGLPYLFLPIDWMAEYRFATPFFPFFYAYGIALAAELGRELLPEPRRRLPSAAGTVLVIGLSLLTFASRSLLFAASPTVPFGDIVRLYGLRYNHFADLLKLERGSILLPDLGGTLWVSRLRVYDLVGLTDRTIARTLEHDPQKFYDYIFDEAKPTFIHVHQYWTYKGGLDYDPRFARDYLPLYQEVEPVVQQRAGGYPLRSGDFLRRDVAEGRDEGVKLIQEELAEYYRLKALRGRPQQGPEARGEEPPAGETR